MLSDPHVWDTQGHKFCRVPEEGSKGERVAGRVLRDVRGVLGLGVWGRLPSNLVTSPGKGGLLAAGRVWITVPDAIQDGDHVGAS